MTRLLTIIYGVVAYALALGTITYAVGFVGDLLVPKSIDVGGSGPWIQAVIINLALLAIFASQHSIMARQGFKRWWTKFVPKSMERSTYVLAAGLILAALFWFWVPIPGDVWRIEVPFIRTVLLVIYFIGWGMVLLSTFLIDHFNLFGLSQVFAAGTGKEAADPEFRTPMLYKIVRHPLYLGFLLAIWSTPVMTYGHLLFAVAITGYIFIGILLEERDMVDFHGETYVKYRKRVRMILPLPVGRSSTS